MLGLYIHIPFCKKKCFYCDFFSIEYNEYLSSQYIEALSIHCRQNKGKKVDTVYIGGGTPSSLPEKQISKLFNSINDNFDTSTLKEFTFELNPESVSADKLKILKDFGVNRLSMGLQSVENELLSKIGRIHDFAMFEKAYNSARKAGFDNFNLDLIYGLPGQTLASWKNNLHKVVNFDCEHISLYPLTIEEGTTFFKSGIIVDDNLQRDMYEESVRFFSEKAFNHYEISNWAKPGKESVHNSNYWRNFEYIALGAGASGYLDRIRYKNIENIEKYINLIYGNLNVRVEEEVIDDELFEKEEIMLGFRLLNEGVNINLFKKRKQMAMLDNYLKQKILLRSGDNIFLSDKYIFISDSIILSFFN